MKMLMSLFLILLSINSFAEVSLHAHEHGSIRLETAVEGKTVNFSVDGPSESFLGFEYLPKTVKDKKVFEYAKNLWTKNFLNLISFERSVQCKITESSFEQKFDEHDKKNESHSDIEASSKLNCNRDLKGIKIIVNMKKYFKNIKKLKMDIIGNETKTIDINSESFEMTF